MHDICKKKCISNLTIYNNIYFSYREPKSFILEHHQIKFKDVYYIFVLITINSNLVAVVVTIKKIMLDDMRTLP